MLVQFSGLILNSVQKFPGQTDTDCEFWQIDIFVKTHFYIATSTDFVGKQQKRNKEKKKKKGTVVMPTRWSFIKMKKKESFKCTKPQISFLLVWQFPYEFVLCSMHCKGKLLSFKIKCFFPIFPLWAKAACQFKVVAWKYFELLMTVCSDALGRRRRIFASVWATCWDGKQLKSLNWSE